MTDYEFSRKLDIEKLWKPWRDNTRRFTDVLPFHSDYLELLENTERLAYITRSLTTYEMTCGSLGHPGGSMSEAELLSVLYNYVLSFDSKEKDWTLRDVFYLSKCHACPSLYTMLALFGYFDLGDLKYYGQWGSILESHPDCTKTPGIEVSGGSLGQIPGVAVGRALAMSKKGPEHAGRLVYTLIGDGECQEGSVWESFMAASQYKLDNIVFLIDYNKVQAKGFVNQDMAIEPLDEKLRAFGHQVYVVENGHDVSELVNLFNKIRTMRCGKPISVIVNTVKGKKIKEACFNMNWHTSAPKTAEVATRWLEELWEQDGKRLGIPHSFVEYLSKSIEKVPPLHDNPDAFKDSQA